MDDRTIRCAQIFIALIPIMLIYPFAQKYFVKGPDGGIREGLSAAARSYCFVGKRRERRKKVTVKVRSSYGNGAKAAEIDYIPGEGFYNEAYQTFNTEFR